MNASASPVCASRRHACRGIARGEFLILAVFIGLFAGMATAGITKVRNTSEITAVLSDLRVFSAAFQGYALEEGHWPTDTSASGIVPVGMETRLELAAWQREVVGGGRWDWNADTNGVRAAISIWDCALSEAQLEQIDGMLDDGDLATGRFRFIAPDRPALVLAER